MQGSAVSRCLGFDSVHILSAQLKSEFFAAGFPSRLLSDACRDDVDDDDDIGDSDDVDSSRSDKKETSHVVWPRIKNVRGQTANQSTTLLYTGKTQQRSSMQEVDQ